MESNDEAINDDRDIDLPILEEGQLLGLKKWDRNSILHSRRHVILRLLWSELWRKWV